MKKLEAKITILCFGSELTDGNTLDTNSRFMARALLKHGFSVQKIVKIPDDEPVMMKTLTDEFRDANLLLTTGGLGPTFDDLTIPVLGKFFNRPMQFNRFAYESIAVYFKMRGKNLQKRHHMQAFLPKGCEVIANRVGVCPALCLTDESRRVIAMPGVPTELEDMFESSVIPFILKHYAAKPVAETFIRTAASPEVVIEKKVLPVIERYKNKGVTFGIYPGRAEVALKVKAAAGSLKAARLKVREVVRKILPRINEHYYGLDDDTLAGVVADLLIRKRLLLSAAESCTGGLLAKGLTDIPGSSRFFAGSCVAYQNKIKKDWLGVKDSALRQYGTVSSQVAKQMAIGAREKFGTDIAVGITGIAGPGGGSKEKPVGLVYLAIATKSSLKAHKLQLHGDRVAIREKTVKFALFYLFQELKRAKS